MSILALQLLSGASGGISASISATPRPEKGLVTTPRPEKGLFTSPFSARVARRLRSRKTKLLDQGFKFESHPDKRNQAAVAGAAERNIFEGFRFSGKDEVSKYVCLKISVKKY